VRDAGVAATALVAWQRVHADQHWTSDTIAGAMVGHWMGELVVRALRREQGRR
jgi:membrane-associated phospholipid phosphatase